MKTKRNEKKEPVRAIEPEEDEDEGTGMTFAEFRMSLVEHLSEFRKRLMISATCFLVAAIACMARVQWFVRLLISRANGFDFVYISPTELVTSYIKLALTGGLIIASPIIVYQIWAFIRPGLMPHEKRAGFFALLFGMLLFVVGASFAFIVVMPFMLEFFLGLGSDDLISPMISFESYMNFVSSTLLTFGLVFEMPVVTVLLTQIGLLKPSLLVKSRRVVLVLCFVVGAIITPPDIVSQVLVAIPMMILYEISVVACKVIIKNKARRLKAKAKSDLALG